MDFDPPPSSREALRHVVYGEELDPPLGDLYANAVEVICLHLGSSYQETFPPEYIEELDKLLKRLKCPVEVSDLAYRGSPLPIRSNDITTGYWDPRQVHQAHSFFRGVEWPRAEELSRKYATWVNILEEALEHGEDSLVGFVY